MTKTFRLILLLFLCGTLSTVAQNSRSRIGIVLLPGMTESYYTKDHQYYINIEPRFTFNYGFKYIKGINKSFLFFETGIYYSDRGFIQKYYPNPADPIEYFPKSDIYIHNYYISFPLLLRFEFKHIYASIGPTVDCYTNSKFVWKGEEDKIDRSSYCPGGLFERFKMGAVLNLGSQIKINDRLGLFIEGSISPSDFNKYHANDNYSFYLNYLLGVGITYNLQK